MPGLLRQIPGPECSAAVGLCLWRSDLLGAMLGHGGGQGENWAFVTPGGKILTSDPGEDLEVILRGPLIPESLK